MSGTRTWCAEIRWPGLEPVVFGTVAVRTDAPLHEVERAVRDHARTSVPDGFEILDLIPGMVVFVPDDEVVQGTRRPEG